MNIWKAMQKRLFKSSSAKEEFSWLPELEQEKKIAKFLSLFSRYEYAPKKAGYLVKNAKEAKADWDSFIVDLEGENIQIPNSLQPILVYLKAQPVRKQMADDTWQAVPRNTDWEWLLRSLTTIRNNLFHGGKQGVDKLLADPRDELLVDYSQTIMEETLKVATPIQKFFS